MTRRLAPGDLALRPADVTQPVLFDIDPGERFDWPMPLGGPIEPKPCSRWYDGIAAVLSAWDSPFEVGI